MNRNSFPLLIKNEKKESTGFSPGNRGKIFNCSNFIFNQQMDLASNKESVHSLPTIYAPLYMYANSTKVYYPNRELLFSQMLDLYEIIFNQKNMPIELSLSEEINVIDAVPDDKKDEKGEIVKVAKQNNPFLTAIKKLNPEEAFNSFQIIKCKFEGKEEILGITTPFTLVCPIADITNTYFYKKNPNYFHIVRKLEERNLEFISYMHDIHEQVLNSELALHALSYMTPFRTYLVGLLETIEQKSKETISKINVNDYEDTPFITLKFKKEKELRIIDLKCYKKNEEVRSRFKIKPSKKFAPGIKLPLILKTGLIGKYFNEYNFPADFRVTGEGTDVLPVYNYKYDWVNPLTDFLEPVLIILDYEINKEFLRIGKKKDGIKKCLLPLKPRFFEYFEGKDVNDFFEIEMQSSGKEWKVKLNIPIDDNKIKALQFEKIYTLNERERTDNIGSVVELIGNDCPYFAFWPNLKCEILRDYFFVVYNTSSYKLKIDCALANETKSMHIDREPAFSVNRFASTFPDNIRICISNNIEDYYAMICPNSNNNIESFDNTGNVYVSIDFGTTNTNVGVHLPRQKEQLWSFDNERLLQYLHDEATLKNEWTSEYVWEFKKLISTYFLPERVQFQKTQQDSLTKIAQIPFGSLLLELLDNTNLSKKKALCHINIPYYLDYGDDILNQLVFEFKWGQKNEYIKRYLEEVLILVKTYLLSNHINPKDAMLLTAYPMVYSSTAAEEINNVWKNIWVDLGYGGHTWIDEGTASKVFYSKETGGKLDLSEGTSIVLDIGGGTTDFCITTNGKIQIADSILFGGRDIVGWFGIGSEDPKKNAMNPIVRFLEYRIHDVLGKDPNSGIMQSPEYQKNINSQLKFRYLQKSPNYSHFNDIVFSNYDFSFSKIIIGYFYLSIFYYLGMLFKSNKEINSQLPSLICVGGNSSRFLDWLVKTEWETSVSKPLVNKLFNDYFNAGFGNHKSQDSLFQIYKSDQPKNEVVLGLLYDPPESKDFSEIYKNRYCIYGDGYSIKDNRVSVLEEQIRETGLSGDGKKNLRMNKREINEIYFCSPEKSNFYSFNQRFISSLENLVLFEDISKSEKSREYLKSISSILLDFNKYTDILRDELDLYIADASEEISTSLFILSAKGMLHRLIRNANETID